MTGIYLHIPFCAKKCAYCDFFSTAFHSETMEQYVQAICRNIAAYTISDTVDTLYFGGGTPSLLSLQQVECILSACRASFHMAKDAEITMEWNPTGNRSAHLRELYQLGVNRISIGTQSFSDQQLSLLGRTHTAKDGIRTVLDAHAGGFSNISCDLMLACPGQTQDVLEETLDTLCKLPITHVSAYLLQVEEGTPLAQNAALLQMLPDEDDAAERYLQAVNTLETAGWKQYEVSSFAMPGYESRHNLKYWKCEPYLGIGAGAHSCFDGKRFSVPKDIRAFCDAMVQPVIVQDVNPCNTEERLMLALRTAEGIPVSAVSMRSVKPLEAAGYVRIQGERLSLTPKGFLMSNAVIAALLEKI